MSRKIVVLAGDGIGPEIMAAALDVFHQLIQIKQWDFILEEEPFGGKGIDVAGEPFPDKTKKACETADAILLGAIGGPKWDKAPERPEQGLLALRRQLKLYANIRPIQMSPVLTDFSPLRPEIVSGADFVIVRELTGGIYFGKPRTRTDEAALDTCRYEKNEIQRILRYAFQLAQTRRKKVTSVDKANVLATSKLWRQVAEEVAQEFPECELEHQFVDSAAMSLIKEPRRFDVVVTENLFGDILSDEASMIPGSLGVMPSASHSIDGPSLYEPIHGSAPDIAGLGIANPVSMLRSLAMMLRESFKEREAADWIETACTEVMEEGIFTKDLGGTATTQSFTKAVQAKIRRKTDGNTI